VPRPRGSADLLEDRRKRALTLLRFGLSLNEVGRRIRSSASSVMRWRDAWRRGGAKALKVRFSPGRPWKLCKGQRQRLIALLLKGAIAYGYRTNLWTTARIAEVIERKFGVRYHRDHVGRLMHSLKWSPQKPKRRALERKEAKIERWKKKEWPRVKKTLRGWAPISYSPTNRASS
jgi:transposase